MHTDTSTLSASRPFNRHYRHHHTSVAFTRPPSKLKQLNTKCTTPKYKSIELLEAYARTEAAVPAKVLLHTLFELYIQHATSALYTDIRCNQTNTSWCYITATITHTCARRQN